MFSVVNAKSLVDAKRKRAEQKAHLEELAQIAGEGASKKDFGSRFNKGVGLITDAPVHPEYDIPTRLSAGSFAESLSDDEKVRGCWARTKRDVLEQKISGATPLLTVSRTLISLTAFSMLCIIFGLILLVSAAKVNTINIEFGGAEVLGTPTSEIVRLEADLVAPWFVHLKLTDYFQNMRTYMIDRDNQQLTSGDPGDGGGCIHLKKAEDGRVRLPCGLIARSVFNDTFQLQARRVGDSAWRPLELTTSGDDFLPEGFLDMKNPPVDALNNDESEFWREQDFWLIYRYPPQVCVPSRSLEPEEIVSFTLQNRTVEAGGKTYTVPDCTNYGGDASCNFEPPCGSTPGYSSQQNPDGWGLENRHFQVWMNTAAIPQFKKLWGEGGEPLSAGDEVRMVLLERYPVEEANFKKALSLSNPNWQGGESMALGLGLVLIGVLYQAWACYIFLQNKKKPRVFGDAKLFNFSAAPSHLSQLEAKTIKAGKKMAHRAKEGWQWLSHVLWRSFHPHSLSTSRGGGGSNPPAQPARPPPPPAPQHGVSVTRQSIS